MMRATDAVTVELTEFDPQTLASGYPVQTLILCLITTTLLVYLTTHLVLTRRTHRYKTRARRTRIRRTAVMMAALGCLVLVVPAVSLAHHQRVVTERSTSVLHDAAHAELASRQPVITAETGPDQDTAALLYLDKNTLIDAVQRQYDATYITATDRDHAKTVHENPYVSVVRTADAEHVIADPDKPAANRAALAKNNGPTVFDMTSHGYPVISYTGCMVHVVPNTVDAAAKHVQIITACQEVRPVSSTPVPTPQPSQTRK